jgi:hypothetical protein
MISGEMIMRSAAMIAHAHTVAAAREQRRKLEMARRKTPPPANETPNGKFRRLGNYKLKKVLALMDGLAKLSSPFYESTNEQRSRIIEVLQHGVDRVSQSFADKPAIDSNETYL